MPLSTQDLINQQRIARQQSIAAQHGITGSALAGVGGTTRSLQDALINQRIGNMMPTVAPGTVGAPGPTAPAANMTTAAAGSMGPGGVVGGAGTPPMPGTAGATARAPGGMPDDIYSQYKKLLADPGSIESNPAYQFTRDQGLQATQRKLAAMGLGNSGNILAELEKQGSGMAAQEFQRFADVYGAGATNEANRFKTGEDVNLGYGQQDIGRTQVGNQATDAATRAALEKYRLDLGAQAAGTGEFTPQQQRFEPVYSYSNSVGQISGQPNWYVSGYDRVPSYIQQPTARFGA